MCVMVLLHLASCSCGCISLLVLRLLHRWPQILPCVYLHNPTLNRKQHKKDQVSEVSRKKRRTANKATARALTGASLEVINKRRAEKPEVRQASREAAIREIKERAKKAKAEKAKAQKAPASKQQAPAAKNIGRGKR